MDTCKICEKHKSSNGKVFENDYLVVYHGAVESSILGYFYIEPKRHIEDWDQLTDSEIIEIGMMHRKISKLLKYKLSVERVYSVTISEAVRHLHFHIIPRMNKSTKRGIELIEQATQNKGEEKLNEREVSLFINTAKKILEEY